MAASNLAAWFKAEMVYEGGRVDDPKDPGGRTCWGVTQRVYNGWRRARGLPIKDVWQIEGKEVLDIYKTNYWDKVWGDRLPHGLDVVVADGAINSGVAQSVKWLQRALGTVRVDGIMGDATLKACEAYGDINALIRAVCQRRMAFLQSLKTYKRFGRGWSARVGQVQKMGIAFADGGQPASGSKVADMNRKALLEDAKSNPPKLDAIWGAGTGTGVLAQATSALEPLQNIERIASLLAWLTAIGGLLTVAGLAWAWYARRRTSELRDALDLRPERPVNADDEAPPEGLAPTFDEAAA